MGQSAMIYALGKPFTEKEAQAIQARMRVDLDDEFIEASLPDPLWVEDDEFFWVEFAPGNVRVKAGHVLEIDTGHLYFGEGYDHRSDWPSVRRILTWLRENVSPMIGYGGDGRCEEADIVTDDLLRGLDAVWEASEARRAAKAGRK